MNLRLFSDPHVGLNRTSHTTPASRVKLRNRVIVTAREVADTHRTVVCLGDLFDSANVDPASLIAGNELFQALDLTVFGNHDLSNRMDSFSSIELLQHFTLQSFTATRVPDHASPDSPNGCFIDLGLPCWYVDHKLTQELFEQTLDNVCRAAAKGSVLFLHCNYDSNYATQSSTLNLTRDRAKVLLSKFSYIFIGHEHVSRTDLDGHLILVGNTHPTSFADISDKFYWDIDVTNQAITKITPVKIWDANKGSLRVNWADLHELTALSEAVQFVEVTGEAPAEHMASIAKQVVDIWKLSDNLLMVKNAVNSLSSAPDLTVLAQQTKRTSIPEQISADLAGTKLEAVWNQYLNRL